MIGVAVGSLFNGKIRKMWRGEHDALRILRLHRCSSAQYVWVHAASLGEFEQGRPLIEMLRRLHPEYKILLTFFSPSGYEVRKNYAGADIVCYLPLDTRRNAHRFLEVARPAMAFFIKYEFWYNYLHLLKRYNVPVYSVSSIFRPGQIFFRWYAQGYAQVLKCITKFFVQNEVSRQLLASIGINDVEVIGDTRFDRVVQVKQAHKQLPIVEAFCCGADSEAAKKIFVAGSSWPVDEAVYTGFFKRKSDWKIIIAPHVVNEARMQHIAAMVGGSVVRYTSTTPEEAVQADCLVIDCFGLLSSVYAYADVAYVGGGFGVGIHNVLEAAVWGVPVVFGPNNHRFAEARALIDAGGGHEITDATSFKTTMERLAGDEFFRRKSGEAAGAYVDNKTGATEYVLKSIGL